MAVRHFRIWHYSEVLMGSRHDRYRMQTRRSAEVTNSAEFDPIQTRRCIALDLLLPTVARTTKEGRSC
jgi:hypothetical protein